MYAFGMPKDHTISKVNRTIEIIIYYSISLLLKILAIIIT